MSATHVLIELVGQVALLLWGLHMVQSGVLRAFGSHLRAWLGQALSNRFSALAAGIGVTTMLQSSTATALMTASFATAGLVGLMPALAVMLGANIGTALIVQILSLDMSLLAPLCIAIGLGAWRRGGRTQIRDLGRVAIGLGLVLLSLRLMGETVKPIETLPALQDLLHAITRDTILNILLAAVFAWLAHASVASVLFIMSLAGAGAVMPEAALAMVLGANLGSAVNPLLEGTMEDPATLRVPLANLANRLIGIAIAVPLLPMVSSYLTAHLHPGLAVPVFHLAFNVATALLFIAVLPLIARITRRLLPERVRASDPGTPIYLDQAALATPSVALANAAREVLRMADVLDTMLHGSIDVFRTDDRKKVAEIKQMDDIVDRLHGALNRYVSSIAQEDALTDADRRRISEILAFSVNLEHMGDVIEKSLMEIAAKRIRLQLRLSAEEIAEVEDMHHRLCDHLRLAIATFMFGDDKSARRLIEEKDRFRDLERDAANRHFSRLQSGDKSSIEISGLILDIFRDLKRIESHIAATANPLLEASGALKATRLS